jgi:isoleucyl-tRNA synthetase
MADAPASPSAPRFHRLPTSVELDLVAMEHRILEWWESERIFERSLEAREGADRWTFYEGPPTANGLPGTHHIEARAFKDVFPRYQTMRGRYVPRVAGGTATACRSRSPSRSRISRPTPSSRASAS